jgi:hypothetical protein
MFYHLGSLGFQNPSCMPPSMPLEMPGKYIIPMNDLSSNLYKTIGPSYNTHASFTGDENAKNHASFKYM